MSALTAGRFDALRLIRTRHVGPVAFRQLLARFGNASAALDALPDLSARGGALGFRAADRRAVEAECERVYRLGARYCFLGEPDYPPLLAEADGAPPALILRGDMALAARRCVAIVGARNASAAAVRLARELAHGLAAVDIVVVSGLARGIDTAAHNGAGPLSTIAVIGSGIDVVFPPENAELQERIAVEGLLLTELPPGAEPLARHFPARNRIIAWMSLGTVVVEAAPRSGSLLTARLAGEEGRDVMAVPGFPADPRAQGCNSLIREGATLVQSAADIIEAIGAIDQRALRSPCSPYAGELPSDLADRERRAVRALLSLSPVSVDELIRQSGLAPALVQTALLELEIAGHLRRHAGGRVSLS
ncbi:DNA-processing protein DprA [Sphingobium nicotianae]|uniref:DNA-processing protein DprA n=1 Tax=Sphingobium nicotianae TaxID=2782607 RepID=A0A9X1AIT6_9SPHN|nr:DNA-processing protein DprA [Sphingobium nicotianae]MBT2185386.1 DNA-processing protein DprA [Sphingobium nicotianae]